MKEEKEEEFSKELDESGEYIEVKGYYCKFGDHPVPKGTILLEGVFCLEHARNLYPGFPDKGIPGFPDPEKYPEFWEEAKLMPLMIKAKKKKS